MAAAHHHTLPDRRPSGTAEGLRDRWPTARRWRRAIVWPVLLAALVAARDVRACSVPVFRFALDHWFPDNYRIVVLHRGALTDELAGTVAQLQARCQSATANATVEVADVGTVSDPGLVELVGRHSVAEQPLCVLQIPTEVRGVYRDVWTAPLEAAVVDALLDSPLRRKLAERLVSGTSIVWIYLDSGIAAVDDAQFALLESELRRLEGILELPEIDPADLKDLSVAEEDLSLSFHAIRLPRDDAREEVLVQMLLSTEPDLRDPVFLQAPMAFPVFGRGRVLYSLVGQGINPGTIEEACRFLTGACQCTVKAQNPGVDLLLSVAWDGLITPTAPVEVDVTLTGLAAFQSDGGPTDRAADAAASASNHDNHPAPQAEPALKPERATDLLLGADRPPDRSPVAVRREVNVTSASRPLVILAIVGLAVVALSLLLLRRR